jgi:2-methylcitrate dehydratase PrpD
LPRTTEEAQYSLSFPVAAALVFGRVAAAEVDAPGLSDPRVARLVGATIAVEDVTFSRRFPGERWARVRIELADRRMLVSPPAQARGEPDNPLSASELREKYRCLAEGAVGRERARRIEHAVETLSVESWALTALLEDVLAPL